MDCLTNRTPIPTDEGSNLAGYSLPSLVEDLDINFPKSHRGLGKLPVPSSTVDDIIKYQLPGNILMYTGDSTQPDSLIRLHNRAIDKHLVDQRQRVVVVTSLPWGVLTEVQAAEVETKSHTKDTELTSEELEGFARNCRDLPKKVTIALHLPMQMVAKVASAMDAADFVMCRNPIVFCSGGAFRPRKLMSREFISNLNYFYLFVRKNNPLYRCYEHAKTIDAKTKGYRSLQFQGPNAQTKRGASEPTRVYGHKACASWYTC